ncbi:VWA domain-containing protein [Treponema putidum]|uniref:vWA domain-containing protein n=1 Tax=Treponema putidum TaxID=221027 RepID=UPI0004F8A70D|nr:VWA domain-containing protein [Treponema putidum]AIN94656.1 von Willebrand factor type A domain-containing protein [Treponema putidum]TWI78733.1 uncharacterized protein YegL [Treponema putidum]
MKNDGMVIIDDLVDNPTARIPICLCLDTSDSMNAVEGGSYIETGETIYKDGREWSVVDGGETRISALLDGIKCFFSSIRNDEIALYSAEICIVTFNDTAKCILDFENIERQNDILELEASGNTAMGEGVNLALDLLELRKREYKDKGIDSYKPWLVLMTDGVPNGDENELNSAIERTSLMVNQGKLTVFPIAIGNEVDRQILNKFSPKRSALKLKTLKFEEFFLWLSMSISKVSQSIPGESVKLDPTDGWGILD